MLRSAWFRWCAALSLVLLAATAAYRYVDAHFSLSYDSAYRDCTEDLLYPCVGRLGTTIEQKALDASPEWQAFAAGRSRLLDCTALERLPRTSTGHLSEMQRYLHASLSALFWLGGPRRGVYVAYMTGMVAMTVLAVYGVMSLAVSPVTAFVATLAFALSDLHLQNALHPAEYAKAPFFVACVFLVGAIVTRWSSRGASFALAAAAGLVVGIGLGFKTDLLICVPVVVVAIAIFAPASVRVSRRVALLVVFAATLLLSGWPVLTAQFDPSYGSLFPVQVLGGMNRNFADWYARPSLYDYGVRFDDTHITYLINSYAQRVQGAREFAEFYSKGLQHAAVGLVFAIDRLFPADFLLRWFAAIADVLKAYRIGLAAAVVVLPLLLVTNPRLGGFVVFLLCTAVGYTSVVFQTKHFFHLAWIPLWFAAVAIEQAIVFATDSASRQPRFARAHVRRFCALALIAGVMAVGLVIVRRVQQAHVTSLIAALMRQDRDQSLRSFPVKDDDDRTVRVSVEGLGSVSRTTPLVEDYVVLDVECSRSGDVVITAVYEQATSPRERMHVPCSVGARHWTLFWPVYQYPPASRFRWFETDGDAGIRIGAVGRVANLRDIPVLLKLAVPDDYLRRRWYQTLRPRFFVEPLLVRQTT